MQKLIVGLMFGSLLASTAPAAMAGARPTEAVLAKPVEKPVKVVIDGRVWTCEGDVCKGKGIGYDQPLRRECSRAAKVLGEFLTYRNGGRALDEAGIAACKPA